MEQVIKRIIIFIIVICTLFALVFFVGNHLAHADSNGKCAGYPNGVCESCTLGQCGGKDAIPPNPDRTYFDGCGNEYSYNGVLIKAGNGCPTTTTVESTTNNLQPFIGK